MASVERLLISLIFVASTAHGFSGQDYQSVGYHYSEFADRAIFNLRLDGGYFAGEITTSPPDDTKLVKRLEMFIQAEQNFIFSPKLALFWSARDASMVHAEEDKEEPKTYVDESEHRIRPALSVAYRTDASVDVYVGGEGLYIPKRYQKTTSIRGVSRKQYDSLVMARPFAGVQKRFGLSNVGMFYKAAVEKKRKFHYTTYDDKEFSGEDTVFDPIELGVYLRTKISPIFELFAELNSIQAGTGGERDASGKSTGEDNYRLVAKSFIQMASEIIVAPGMVYQTLGYGDSTYMTFENVPYTSFNVDAIFGSSLSGATVGLVMSRAADEQSLPEFNASYRYLALALSVGYRAQF